MRKLRHAAGHRQQATVLALMAALGLAACGSGSSVGCGELRADPAGFATLADKMFVAEGETSTSDCNSECRSRFTAGIEHRLRAECRGAAADHDPQPAVRRWLHED